jgi:hypothetical protein
MERLRLLDHAMGPAEQECLQRTARFPSAVNGNGAALAAFWKGCE